MGRAALGVLCIGIAGFAALYAYGYSLVPHPAAAPETAQSHDPHSVRDVFSKDDLAALMPPVPAGASLASEKYEANAYCLDVCPTYARTYRFRDGRHGACAAIVAAAAAYASEGYAPDARLPKRFRGELPATVTACLSARTAPFRIAYGKNTSPTSKTSFTFVASVDSAGTLSVETREF